MLVVWNACVETECGSGVYKEKCPKKAQEWEDRLFNLFVTCLGIKPAKSVLFF